MENAPALVYVVDDDPSVREAAAGLLSSAGLKVRTFTDALAVFACSRKENPYCIVLDLQMPGLSGLELQEQLMAAEQPPPIVFLTGVGCVPDSVRAMKAGAVDFLIKPLAGPSLLRAVRQGIGRFRQRQPARTESAERGGRDRHPRSSSGRAAKRFEHYEVLRREDGSPWELGRGAMGVTYKALDTRLKHHVALKVVPSKTDEYPDLRERFLHEARMAARLRHPNVASVFHLGDTAGKSAAFYAMEFIEGETLEARVTRQGPLSVWLALELGIEVARALLAASAQGLVHRDLKPANVMLVKAAEAAATARALGEDVHAEKAAAWVKVIDFGLVKAADTSGPLTGAGEFLGTPQYASPEQFAGAAHADVRSDIYALGGLLAYALTGQSPRLGGSLTEIHRQKLSGKLHETHLQWAGLPEPALRLLTTLLSPAAGDRPQNASLLLQALCRCREELRREARVETGTWSSSGFPARWRAGVEHQRLDPKLASHAACALLALQIAVVALPPGVLPGWVPRSLLAIVLAGLVEAALVNWMYLRAVAGKSYLPASVHERWWFVLLALSPLVTLLFCLRSS